MFDGQKPIPRALTLCGECGARLPTSAERKQTEELIAALRLIHRVPEFAGGQLEHADRPDLRVHLGGRVYGLEVTRIVRGDGSEIAQAQWKRDVERSARLLRRSRGAPPVWVSLRWNAHTPRADANAIARQLDDFVERGLASVPMTDHAVLNVEPDDLIDNDLQRYVHGLHAVRMKSDDNWTSGFVAYPDVQPQEIQGEIDEKATKVAGYTDHPDGLWLLIYAEATNAAQALDLTDEARAATYSGPFDRILFLDSMDKVGDLKLR